MNKNKSIQLLSIFVMTLVAYVSPAHSEVDQPIEMQRVTTTTNNNQTVTKVRERKAILNFEDELVEGSTQKPELFYLFQKKNFNYNRLIKLRENFLPEMRKTTEHVQRVRGGN